jgi:hypothetical protein
MVDQVYYSAGDTDVASALLATVLLSTTLQMAGVAFIHRRRGSFALGKELAIVLSGCKPLVDTRRMVSGFEFVGVPVDLRGERTYCKMIELVVESVPSVTIVICNTLAGRGLTTASYVAFCSIFVSLLTIATTSTGVFFGFDSDPESRLKVPRFYGCVRDTALQQALTRVSLYLFTLTHAALKLLSIAMMVMLSKVAVAMYLFTTMALFLLIKLLRGDLYYFPPNSGMKVAIIMRIMVKLFIDVTANPQFRSVPLCRPGPALGPLQGRGFESMGAFLQAPL